VVGIYDPQHVVDWLVPGRELFLALHVLGVACFIYIVSKRLVPLLRAQSDPRFDRPLVRLGRVFKFWLGIPKRRADWRLGRWTAKHAVAACLNLPDEPSTFADIEIRAASSGAPEVFLQDRQAEIAISLSHSSGTALCTLGTTGNQLRLRPGNS
jgi:phosphopantetheinyl transferase (holo-ACP synthase)